MKTVFVDIDMTLNKFWETYVYYYNNIYNTHKHITKDDFSIYSIPTLLGIPPEKQKEVSDRIFSIQGIWEQIPVFEDSIPVVEKLNKKYNLYIATQPWPSSDNCYVEKIKWMKKWFPFIKTEQIIFIHDKSVLKGDLLVDDSPTHLKNFCGKTIAFDYLYNRECKTAQRIFAWNMVNGLFDKLLEEK